MFPFFAYLVDRLLSRHKHFAFDLSLLLEVRPSVRAVLALFHFLIVVYAELRGALQREDHKGVQAIGLGLVAATPPSPGLTPLQ